MKGGLRLRLLAAFGTVAVVSVAAVTTISVHEARVELETVLGGAPSALSDELVAAVETALAADDPAEARRAVAPLETPDRVAVVVDATGRVVSRSPALEGHRIEPLEDGGIEVTVLRSGPGWDAELTNHYLPAAAVGSKAGTAGRLYFVSPGVPSPPAGLPGGLAGRLWIGGAVVALLAVAATAVATRWILRPVAAMRSAAERMTAGDLTARVEVYGDDELGELGGAFNRLAVRLEAQDGLRRRLVADVAHELRTPLTAIRCQVEAFEDGVVEPDQEAVRMLQSDVAVLERLVGDLQELATAESDALALERRPVAVVDAVRAAVAAAAGGSEVRVDVPAGLHVHADPDRLVQVLANLVANARAATSAGGAIAVGAAEGDGQVAVWVADTGRGIAAGHLPHLFERFYRVEASRDRDSGGAGVGLAIVRRLVEAHGGTVEVASEPGRGSRFTVRLPAVGGEGEAA